MPASRATSSTKITVASRSDQVAATCGSPVRRVTRQSTRRRRSPAVNRRTPASSPPSPGRRDRCSPTNADERGIAWPARNVAGMGKTRRWPTGVSTGSAEQQPIRGHGECVCRTHRVTAPPQRRAPQNDLGHLIGRQVCRMRTLSLVQRYPAWRSDRATTRSIGRGDGFATRTTTVTSLPSTGGSAGSSSSTVGSAAGRRHKARAAPTANGAAIAIRSGRPNNEPRSTSTPTTQMERANALVGVHKFSKPAGDGRSAVPGRSASIGRLGSGRSIIRPGGPARARSRRRARPR